VRTLLQVLLVCAALDTLVGGALLALVWFQHRRQRDSAARLGLPVPPPATGQFAVLGLVVAAGFATLCVALWLLSGE
jgi:hypothetical protein